MTRLSSDFLIAPIAHRALHDVTDGRPENSRAAIRAAMKRGYGIEIDLQLSRDGHAMAFHDYNLERLTDGTGPIQQQTAKDLAGLTLKGGNEGIPTLQDVLELVAGQVPLLIEFKDQHGQMGAGDQILETSVAPLLNAYKGPLAVMSFNPHTVVNLAELCPNIARGIVTCAYTKDDFPLLSADIREGLRSIPDYNRAGASFISHDRSDLNNPRVAELKAEGAHILCWTVRSPSEEAEARKVVDNITFEQYLAPHPA
jgi:glycerophosphoryl diester phosphodiesterase